MTREKIKNPPKFAEWILRSLYPDRGTFTSLGDFREEYLDVYYSSSPFKAKLWYWKQIIRSLPSFIRNKFHWNIVMIRNYLKVALRNIKRNKVYSFINLSGLSVGMACSIFIFLYIKYELSFDRYHQNGKHIYRIIHRLDHTFKYKNYYAQTPSTIAPVLKRDFPEVINAARLEGFVNPTIRYKDKVFVERRFYFGDPEILEIFSFPLLKGEPESCLKEPFSVLISEGKVEKYFDDEDPMGKLLDIDGKDYVVRGILKDTPENSHFIVDFFASLSSQFRIQRGDWVQTWRNFMYQTYFQVLPDCDIDALEKKLPVVFRNYFDRVRDDEYPVQHLFDIHFFNKAHKELETNADARNIYIFSVVAFLILIISCINYMNLSTARSIKRAKEVGLRKVVGANRAHLVKQFLGESIVFSFIALSLSILCVRILLPFFNTFIDKKLSFNLLGDGKLILILLGITLFTGIASGSYPAFVLSSFKPAKIVKGITASHGKGSSGFRNSLVVIQFVISIVLIVCALIVNNQLHYIKNKELGFAKESIIAIPANTQDRNQSKLTDEYRKHPGILDITTSNTLPINMYSARGGMTWEGKEENDDQILYLLNVDYNYLNFYGHEIVQGTAFSKDFSPGSQDRYILNETAVKSIGWEEPIGKKFENGIVVGVVKDFHFAPLHQGIEPLVMGLSPTGNDYISLKISSHNIQNTLAFVEKTWKEIFPELPYSYFFLDDRIERLYQKEFILGQILNSFTAIAIFIACLGLFGLALFTAENRTKEIGIRKILGASAYEIVTLLSKDLLKWVLAANILALPISYYAMDKWLQNFAYRIHIRIDFLVLSVTLALVISLSTISFQTIRAATASPADALRYE